MHAFDGHTGMDAQGLSGAGERSEMLRANFLGSSNPAAPKKPVICRHGKSRSTYTSRPVFHAPENKPSIHLAGGRREARLGALAP